MRNKGSKRVGIIGGYGTVGLRVAKSLLDTTDYDIIIGGRDKRKCEDAIESMGSMASLQVVDIYDQHSLDNFCRRCDIVINCAGPSRRILDKVALSAIREGIHYVDPSGDDPLYNALADKRQEIKQKGLTFLLSAGTYPGILEVLPVFEAKSQFDNIRYLEYYFCCWGSLSFGSAYDFVCTIEEGTGEGWVYYENGQKKKARSAQGESVILPAPVGRVNVIPVFTQGIARVAKGYNIKSVREYHALEKSLLTNLISIVINQQYKTEAQKEYSANLLIKAAEEDMKAAKEDIKTSIMFHLIMEGDKDGVDKKVISTLFYEDGYELTAIVAANTARLIIDGLNNEPGCFLLDEGLNINEFMALLEQQNIFPVQSVLGTL